MFIEKAACPTFFPPTFGMQNERHGQILVYLFLEGNDPVARLVSV